MSGEREGHPVWCRRDPVSTIGRHVSDEVRVGARRNLGDRGEVSAWLVCTGHGPTMLAVNAAHMTGVTASLSLDAAVELRDGLTALLKAAGRE